MSRPRFGRFFSARVVPFTLGVLAVCVVSSSTRADAGPAVGTISTYAGTGVAGFNADAVAATTAQLNQPSGTAVDALGNLYIADTNNHRIRKIDAGTGVISTVAGSGAVGFQGDGGAATSARLNFPAGIAVTASGDLYIADTYNHRIRKVAAATGIITTVAGTGAAAFSGDNGAAVSAALNYPWAVVVDNAGNLFIADYINSRIRKVSAATGLISTVAGTGVAGYNGDGSAVTASLNYPAGVAVDAVGTLYIADTDNHRIRRVDPVTGLISTIAGTGGAGVQGEAGLATAAQLYNPNGLALDSAGNLYIADWTNDRVRKLTLSTGILSTVAGGGVRGFGGDGGLATAGQLRQPLAVAVDQAGVLYVADTGNDRVRKVTPEVPTLTLTTLAGTGTAGFSGDPQAATLSQVNAPSGVAVDAVGNVYIADQNNNRIRVVFSGRGTQGSAGTMITWGGTGVSGFSGDGGSATQAQFAAPTGVAVDAAGNVFVADAYNQRIRKIAATTFIVTTVAGNGTDGGAGDGGAATSAELSFPTGVAVDGAGNLYIADYFNHRIRKVTAATGLISTVAGTGTAGALGDGGPATSAQLNLPEAVAVDTAGNLYIADSNNHRVRKVAAATGTITTLAGTGTSGFGGESGPAGAAQLSFPSGVAVDAFNNVYVADLFNHRVRKISDRTGLISTVVGSGSPTYGGDQGAATAGHLANPTGVAVDDTGGIYVADRSNHRVRKAAGQFGAPAGLSIVRSGASQITLHWTAAPGAVGYAVLRRTNTTSRALVASGVSGTTYVATDPLTERVYYTVAALSPTDESGLSNEASIGGSASAPTSARSDADGDRKSDVMVYRPSTGGWWILNSSHDFGTYSAYAWGQAGDIPVQGDYDGDGKLDLALYRPLTGTWWIRWSAANFTTYTAFGWGDAGDIPVPADYDGDGRTDIAVYRPSTGGWWRLNSSTNFASYSLNAWGGIWGDVPVPGDYDGDGRADLAVYRPSTGEWWVLMQNPANPVLRFGWGLATDVPVPADYDGDGKTDVAVYRPETGQWWILTSSSGFTNYMNAGWGAPGDVPVPADYDGDGKTDIAVYRPTTGGWWILFSSSNFTTYTGYGWGAAGDVPLSEH